MGIAFGVYGIDHRRGRILDMDNFRDSAFERIGDWLRSYGGLITRRGIAAGAALAVALVAFSVWMSATPEGQALRLWVLDS